jgi:uncharacterized protein (UPF0276 family)
LARAALSLMLEADFLSAALPLFSGGEVDAVEWSMDVGWGRTLPSWLVGLLSAYGERGALYGHGVHLSMLSAEQTPRQDAWLARLREEVQERDYVHLSEHFGWSTAGPFSQGAPLPLPATPAALRVGQARLGRLAAASGLPVGLENLALSFSARDAEALPAFMDALLEPVGGFIVLDLHNLWCQAVNFGLDPVRLLERYPAGRVRELHVSGGSWEQAAGRRFRRDTHDRAVPPPVMALLDVALAQLSGVEVVVFERLGDTLTAQDEKTSFMADFRAIRARCAAHTTRTAPLPPPQGVLPVDGEDGPLVAAQAGLLGVLSGDGGELGVLSDWIARSDPAALQTAGVLAERWLRREGLR